VDEWNGLLQCIAVCCSVLQCVADGRNGLLVHTCDMKHMRHDSFRHVA